MKKPNRDPLKMTAAELLAETRRFDEGDVPPGKPMSPAQRARWDNARAAGTASLRTGPGRPKVGEGAVPVPVSVESALLRRAAAKADALKLKRSEYFAKALQLLTDGQTEINGRTLRTAAATDGPRKATA